jgi:hypothetical protein
VGIVDIRRSTLVTLDAAGSLRRWTPSSGTGGVNEGRGLTRHVPGAGHHRSRADSPAMGTTPGESDQSLAAESFSKGEHVDAERREIRPSQVSPGIARQVRAS